MNLSMWCKDMYPSTSVDEHTPEHLLPFERKSQESFLNKGSEMNRTLLGSHYNNSGELQPSAVKRRGHQAKRARVENIISCMTGSPGWEMKEHLVRIPEVNQQPYFSETLPDDPMWNGSSDLTPRDQDSYREFENMASDRYPGCKKTKLTGLSLEPMADVLKYELSRAVSKSVDSIFKNIPLLQTSHKDQMESSLNSPTQSLGSNNVLNVQTEALSLVVHRPLVDHFRTKVHRLSRDSTPYRDWESDKTPNTELAQTKLDALRNCVKVRSEVNSRSLRATSSHVTTVDPTVLEGIHFPRVKIESSGFLKSHLYILNEGLTTNHLKKAKLMFFYTRYPSSLVLKTCFRDVRLTRCIASQLIKWFSNFREFYYIQMEKFARHAVAEGTAHTRALSVGRESELFRALNGHYNKGGDFQVPNRFLEVAEITLREFYTAISAAKDRDPSWKKAIYKIISKLDADVPAQFKIYG
ncbi:uncharacterized protein LOC130907945 [Corythoichthys intestinalis]|uniref:uncharacterized protein LOC130907945 n=1 Tax=Corythoichthys intestinalis TaxID=161448 RepID=UPI0025A5A883|nr:uncharacterized protein LOC130907945 [Corythoichthys intestinalis]